MISSFRDYARIQWAKTNQQRDEEMGAACRLRGAGCRNLNQATIGPFLGGDEFIMKLVACMQLLHFRPTALCQGALRNNARCNS